MEVTVGQIVTANESLMKLYAESIQPTLAFKLRLIDKQIQPHVMAFNEARQEVLEKFGEKKEEFGQAQWTIPQEHLEEVNTLLNEVLAEKVEVDVKPLPPTDFDKYGLENITVEQLVAIEWLLTEE